MLKNSLERLKNIKISVNQIPIVVTIMIFMLISIAASAIFPGFFSLYNFVNIFKAVAYIGIIAVGMTFVIISGGIDLSVGSVVAFTSIFIAKMVNEFMMPSWIAMLICLAIGITMGFIVGCLITYFE
ncbi:MAG: hypothetical protein PF447_09495 [Spirochaetaceae bacterium]|jgi:ribose/xylose/arabinose/galactoside ABC-type transport system permease subunit|nr:hypothetical protein [Spirochaetaceae bacterium]